MNDNKEMKFSTFFAIIIFMLLTFGGFIIPIAMIFLFIYAAIDSTKKNKNNKKNVFNFEINNESYKNIGKPKSDGGIKIKPNNYNVDFEHKFNQKDYDYMTKEKEMQINSSKNYTTNINENISSEHIISSFKKFDDYSRLIKGMNPQELLELINAFYDEFTHDIYHEASNTAHITHGVALIHNATKKKWYVVRSNDLLHKTKTMFDGANRNELYHEYQAGDTVWIKLLPLHGSPYSSTYEIEYDVIAKYGAKKL